MAISFKDIQGQVGIDYDTLNQLSYQPMPDADTTSGSAYVVGPVNLTANRTLRLRYPSGAASQSAWFGSCIFVTNADNSGGGNNIQVETTDGGGVVNVASGNTALFVLDGTSLQWGAVYNQ